METGGHSPDSDDGQGACAAGAVGVALAAAHQAVDDLAKLLPETTDDELLDLVPELEVVGRRLRALQLAAVGGVDARGLHGRDGHGSARIFERHRAGLSGREAATRAKIRRACRDLPVVRDAYEAGELGTAHADLGTPR